MASKTQHDYGRQAFRLLQVAFVLELILAGLDKFFNLLTNWNVYLFSVIPSILGIQSHSFMVVIGVLEIIVGIGVIFKPKFFSYVVAVWLLLIVINMLFMGMFNILLLRDLGLMLSAFAFGKLSQKYT